MQNTQHTRSTQNSPNPGNTPVTVRRAAPDDLGFLVWVMETAAKSHLDRCCWEPLLGEGTEVTREILRTLARSPRSHWCHLSRFWVAETADEAEPRPVGALTAYDPATDGHAAIGEQCAQLATSDGWPGTAAFDDVYARQQIFQSCLPADYAGSWGIENVAVLPEFRGTGVVDALLDHALELGRAQGYACAQVLCLNGNTRAQRTWERAGFEVRADYRGREFETLMGAPGLKLLVQEYA
ncbi:GNAT family N-acetyltransferase [Streptomyces sp. NPDC050658]|uniref:GNAT family N-acetyltransferase n=1 Tax=unclassified Streptomyces TaxID=2593676 RepID=UPI003412D747